MSEPYRLENWQSGVSMACHAERVRLLFILSRSSVAAGLAATLLVAVWMWSAIGHWQLLVWAGLMLCNLCALVWLQQCYRTRHPRAEDAPRWERWFSIKTAAGGFLWGTTVWLLTPQASEFSRLFLILTLSTICLGATAVLAPSRQAYYAFMAPLMLPTAFFLLLGRPDGIAHRGQRRLYRGREGEDHRADVGNRHRHQVDRTAVVVVEAEVEERPVEAAGLPEVDVEVGVDVGVAGVEVGVLVPGHRQNACR